MKLKSLSLTLVICVMALPAEAADKRFIAFGDSNTFGHGDNGVRCFETESGGYPPRLDSKLLNNGLDVEIQNLGLCAETTTQGITRLQNLDLDADVIILMEGTNDFSDNVSVETVLFNLDRMARTAELSGVVPLMASVVPRGPDENGVQNNFATETLADQLRSMSAAANRVFADPFHALFDRTNFFEDFYFNELHPNAVGFDIVATTFVVPALEAAEKRLPGRLDFTNTVLDTSEGSGTATITVTRSAGSLGAVDVTYETSDGSATSGLDYVKGTGTLSWDDGDLGDRSFDVAIIDDTAQEIDETVNLALANPTGGAVLGFSLSASLTIRDNDGSPSVCVADPNTLCIDIEPGDRRFKLTLHFETQQGGGRVGNALADPLAPLGISKGGIFAFSDPVNPEMLVKVLDGCSQPTNPHFWVFYAATTNFGFELTVTDTATGATKVYRNQDLSPAEPVLDTSAFATCP